MKASVDPPRAGFLIEASTRASDEPGDGLLLRQGRKSKLSSIYTVSASLVPPDLLLCIAP